MERLAISVEPEGGNYWIFATLIMSAGNNPGISFRAFNSRLLKGNLGHYSQKNSLTYWPQWYSNLHKSGIGHRCSQEWATSLDGSRSWVINAMLSHETETPNNGKIRVWTVSFFCSVKCTSSLPCQNYLTLSSCNLYFQHSTLIWIGRYFH